MKGAKWIALVLALTILLTGCSGMSLEELLGDLGAQVATPFSEMEYVRPDIEEMQAALGACCAMAESETDKDKLLD